MHPLEPHAHVAGLHAEALFRGAHSDVLCDEDPQIRQLFAHLSAGCSLCARQFVNARGASIDFLTAKVKEKTPAPALRERIARTLSMRQVQRAKDANPSPRILDPSGSIARLHMQAADEMLRAREVQALNAGAPHPSERASRILSQVQRLLEFPLLFMSVITGERVVAYAQRGLPDELSVLGSLERELSFCTHCVNAERPLLVRDASEEPFFRANPSVRKIGVRAYAGVPLKTSRGIAIGTLCALDFRPRELGAETAAILELFAPLCVDLIESKPGQDQESGLSQKYPKSFFKALIAIEKSRCAHEKRSSALVHSEAQTLPLLCEDDEIVGELSNQRVGILLPRADRKRALERIASLGQAHARLFPASTMLLAECTMVDETDHPT